MKALFVTGTDTGVGKTLVSGLLGRFLLEKGERVITQKWIQTGCGGFSEDVNTHFKLMKRKKRDFGPYLSLVCPHNFKLASSPHLAARFERKTISISKIKRSFGRLSQNFDFVLVEGVGGALVPFYKDRLVIDIAKELGLPVLIVSDNRLGAVNQTLLTVEAVKRRKMRIIGIIFNAASGRTDRIILKDNPRIVEEVSGERILGALPRIKNKEKLYKEFEKTGQRVYRIIRH